MYKTFYKIEYYSCSDETAISYMITQFETEYNYDYLEIEDETQSEKVTIFRKIPYSAHFAQNYLKENQEVIIYLVI